MLRGAGKGKEIQVLAIGIVVVLAVGIFALYQFGLLPTGCQSTSCQGINQQYQGPSNNFQTTTTSAVTTAAGMVVGTAYLDVWANFTDGSSQHFSSSQAYSQQWSSIEIGGKTVKEFTVQLNLVFSSLPSNPTFSGSIQVYTCGACGNPEVNLTAVPIHAPFTKGYVTTFPAIAPTGNLTLLVWPTVTLTSGSVTAVLGMAPLVISNAVVPSASTSTTSPTPNYPAVATLYTVPMSCIEPGSNNCASYTTTSLMNVYQAANALGGVASCTPATPAGCTHMMALYTPLPSGQFVHTASLSCAQAITTYGYLAMPYSGSSHAQSSCSDLTSAASTGSNWYSYGYYGTP